MFEQHPVPQQISSYQFRLVGDMTLKQFFQLAGGALVGLLLYASPLPAIFKWPLIIFAVIAGAAFAFLPLQERPLSEWLAAFFRAIYGPTLFTWQKGSAKENYFAPAQGISPNGTGTAGASTIQNESVAKLEASENKFLSGLGNLFGISTKVSAPQTTATVIPTPTLPTSTVKAPVASPPAQIISQQLVNPVVPIVSQTQTPPQAGTLFVATPQIPKIKVESETKGFEDNKVAETNNIQTSTITPSYATQTATVVSQQAQFAPEAAPPMPSTMPNIIVGQVLDASGKIVDGAIMEVKDFQSHPVRALKTNKLGHFMIVTPLPTGTYSISIEKDGLTFDPISVEVHGTIIPSIQIKAK